MRTRRVSRWRDGSMVLRWAASGLLATEKSFRRILGYEQLWILKAFLDENVASTGDAERKVGLNLGSWAVTTFHYAWDSLLFPSCVGTQFKWNLLGRFCVRLLAECLSSRTQRDAPAGKPLELRRLGVALTQRSEANGAAARGRSARGGPWQLQSRGRASPNVFACPHAAVHHAASSSILSSFALAALAHACHFGIRTATPPTYTSSGVTGSPPSSGIKAQWGRIAL